MKIENQVCSLELAKRLKELGVRQESAFWWSRREPSWAYILSYGLSVWRTSDTEPHFSAFTVAELGEMLPEFFISYRYFQPKEEGGLEQYWRCYNEGNDEIQVADYEEASVANTEADARAKMLIHLIEKGIVKP